jgi:LDH2 family malate/lactate/ureidoglycolate dehydrogenase
VKETATTALIDGERSLGQVVGKKGMELAIAKAKKHGTGFVTIRNSNHYGIAGYYALMAADAGCIGISMTNAAPLVVPTFGRDALLGTNPISIAIPADGRPFILDMATSVVPRGKLEVYDRQGKAMPVGWAVDEKGHITQDPTRVLTNLKKRAGGGILPLGGAGEEFGGHKGYGLALAVEILCGTLSASAFGGQTYVNEQSANVGHFFGAIDVAAFRPLDELKQDLRHYLDSVQESPKAEGHERIYVHGQKGYLFEQDCLARGIPVDEKTLASLKKIGGELGVPWTS